MRTFVYVDGFNLYYGALKGTPFKWLDLVALFEKVLQPRHRSTLRQLRARHGDSKGRHYRQLDFSRSLLARVALDPTKRLAVHRSWPDAHVPPGDLREG